MREKYLVMSLDDGTRQDERVISIFKKYGLTATFNLNGGRLGEIEEIPIPAYDGRPLRHDKVTAKQVINGLYDGFEVACHGFTHAYLPSLTGSEAKKEIDDDYDEIFRLTGLPPRGIAYAGPPRIIRKKLYGFSKKTADFRTAGRSTKLTGFRFRPTFSGGIRPVSFAATNYCRAPKNFLIFAPIAATRCFSYGDIPTNSIYRRRAGINSNISAKKSLREKT